MLKPCSNFLVRKLSWKLCDISSPLPFYAQRKITCPTGLQMNHLALLYFDITLQVKCVLFYFLKVPLMSTFCIMLLFIVNYPRQLPRLDLPDRPENGPSNFNNTHISIACYFVLSRFTRQHIFS